VSEAPIPADANMSWLRAAGNAAGAVVCFSGHVRDDVPDDPLISLELQHYPGMTERSLASIVAEASERWTLQSVCVDHRVGCMPPGELIVQVAVATAHRQAAFEACAFLMDWLKVAAPFWKREVRRSGASWVTARQSDAQARDRWLT
jgi:molybdopterin synthase catalytic subunit